MPSTQQWIDFFHAPAAATTLTRLYGADGVSLQTERYLNLLDRFHQQFGDGEPALFSTPGRTEIGGNHTDHNHGRVLAASVNLDAIAAAMPSGDLRVTLISEGFEPFIVDLNTLTVNPDEEGTTEALIRGIAARFNELGYSIGGFSAVMTSDVLTGSGLSSSAAVEVLIGSIFNGLFNRGKIKPQTLAGIGQYAENVYFGKPCGLMDQMACAMGGILTIDFFRPEKAVVESVDFDFNAQDYALCVVDTGGDHADLTGDYAAIPEEMKAVAAVLGEAVCRPLDFHQLQAHMAELREKAGDRAVLRAMHFIDDNQRVYHQVKALRSGDFDEFLYLVHESGLSSHRWLQNVAPIHHTENQPIGLALALAERFIEAVGEGASRVHGGGFAGTIQVFLPREKVEELIAFFTPAFGPNAVKSLTIRPVGTLQWRLT